MLKGVLQVTHNQLVDVASRDLYPDPLQGAVTRGGTPRGGAGGAYVPPSMPLPQDTGVQPVRAQA